MDLRLAHHRLTAAIGSFAGASLETRQVAKRLRELLPQRFVELKREHVRRGDAMGGKADRLALTDPRYVDYLEQLVEMNGKAREARVQYETYSMLFKARQSLRAFNR